MTIHFNKSGEIIGTKSHLGGPLPCIGDCVTINKKWGKVNYITHNYDNDIIIISLK